jgi:hypothetical protein
MTVAIFLTIKNRDIRRKPRHYMAGVAVTLLAFTLPIDLTECCHDADARSAAVLDVT